MMFTAQLPGNGPFVIRYPRGRGVIKDWKQPMKKLQVGRGQKLRPGNKVAILSIGHIGNQAIAACKILSALDIHPAHYDMRFVKPLDEELLHEVFKEFDKIITIEDGVIAGGFGSAVLEFMADNNYTAKIVRLGIPDKFIEHGTTEQLYGELGYDADSVVKTVRWLLN
jgi:1-deoxy-D-xylulose-5-phosphate synthase